MPEAACVLCETSAPPLNCCRINHYYCNECAVVMIISPEKPNKPVSFCPICNEAKRPSHAPLNAFLCPITQAVMEDPVILEDGFSYEREAITQWLQKNPVSPSTNQPVDPKVMIENRLLRTLIHEWRTFG